MKISLPDRSINCKASEGICIALEEAIRNVTSLDVNMRELSDYYDSDEKKVIEKNEIVWTRSGSATPEVLAQAKALFDKMPPALDEVSAKIFTIRLRKFHEANLVVKDKRKGEAALIAEYEDEEAREKALEAEQKRLDEEWEAEEAAREKKREEDEVERERERVREREQREREKAIHDEEERRLHEGKVEVNCIQTGFILSEVWKTEGGLKMVENRKLVVLVNRDRQGESALRRVAALCPELNGLELFCADSGMRSWNATIETRATHPIKDSTGVERQAFYQIALYHAGWYEPHPGFIDETLAPTTRGAGTKATVRRNHALDGIEIKFPDKPPESVLSQLRSNGFHWHKLQHHWYAKYTTERERFLTTLAA